MEAKSLLEGFRCAGCDEFNPVQIGVKPLPTMCVDCWRDVMDDPTDPDSVLIMLRVGWVVFKNQMEKMAQRAEADYETRSGIFSESPADNDGAGASGGGSRPPGKEPKGARRSSGPIPISSVRGGIYNGPNN